MSNPYPILYSFRRCPYAMRARIGLYKSGVICELREVVLRNKPESMLALSPKGTVPVLQTIEGAVIDESLEVLLWALNQHDPDGWLIPEAGTLEDMLSLINQNDSGFKENLDRYKYVNRYEDVDAIEQRTKAEHFLKILESKLTVSTYLFGAKPSLADVAIAPFIRQFANVDKPWFEQTPYVATQKWLIDFLSTEPFTVVMNKYGPWSDGDDILLFGAGTSG